MWWHIMASEVNDNATVFKLLVHGKDNENNQAPHQWPFVMGVHRDQWIPLVMGQ